MQCKICRSRIEKENGVKTKNGFICQSCFSLLPDSVKLNIESFTARQILKLSKILHVLDSKPWVKSGTFGVTKDGICIKNVEFKIWDLRKVKLNFHPSRIGEHPNTVVGTITVVIETKSPHFIIEEPFFPCEITVVYGINGTEIHYYYSYEIEKLLLAIQNCIEDGAPNMAPYIDKYQKAVHNEEELQKRKAEAEERIKKKKEEEKKKEEAEKKKKEENNKNQQKKTGNEKKPEYLSPFEEAKIMFGVEIPYTKSQIKKLRNDLIKKHHPDNNNGSEDMCIKINNYYKLLMKFAISETSKG